MSHTPEDVKRCIAGCLSRNPQAISDAERNLLRDYKDELDANQQLKYLGIGATLPAVEEHPEVVEEASEGKPCCGTKRGHKKDCPNKE